MFKVGQKVRCINNRGVEEKITLGSVSVVISVKSAALMVSGVDYFLANERFEAIPDEPQPPAPQPEDTCHRPVWIVRGFNALHEKHSLSAAEKLAKESAIANPGQHFTVMSPVSRYVKNDVQRDVMDYYDSAEEHDDAVSDVPF